MNKAREDSRRLVLLVDDDAAIQRGVSALLQAADMDIKVYGSGEDFVSRRDRGDLNKAVILLDLCLPGVHGSEVQTRLRAEYPDLPIIVMTGHGDVQIAVRAMREGATDFLDKPFTPEELLAALARAFAIPRPVSAPTHIAPQLLEAYAKLSDREREVLRSLAAGESTKEIAYKLNISPRTVEVHRRNIKSKTNAKNLADLVRMAIALGLEI